MRFSENRVSLAVSSPRRNTYDSTEFSFLLSSYPFRFCRRDERDARSQLRATPVAGYYARNFRTSVSRRRRQLVPSGARYAPKVQRSRTGIRRNGNVQCAYHGRYPRDDARRNAFPRRDLSAGVLTNSRRTVASYKSYLIAFLGGWGGVADTERFPPRKSAIEKIAPRFSMRYTGDIADDTVIDEYRRTRR